MNTREIKFRAWDVSSKEMFIPEAISKDGSPIIWWKTGKEGRQYPECILMQFTGLKDKNGKDIYEGDIVDFDFDYEEGSERRRSVVNWEQHGFYWYPLKKVGDFYDWVLHPASAMNPMVIGNIYESPELLK